MATAVGGINRRDNRGGCFAKNDLHADRQRSEGVLLRDAKERTAVLQAGEEGGRQVLLQRDVTTGVAKGGERNGREEKN